MAEIKRYLVGIILLLLIVSISNAQRYRDEDLLFLTEENRSGTLFLVPEAGLWFGTYTNIELAPQVGFYLRDRWSIGAGPHYVYYNNPGFLSTDLNSTHLIGIKTFTRFSLIRNAAEMLPFYLFDELFGHLEYERINLDADYFNFSGSTNNRVWVDYLYIGLGLSQNLSPRSSYFFMLLWNLNDSYFSLYTNPTYRVGVAINLN